MGEGFIRIRSWLFALVLGALALAQTPARADDTEGLEEWEIKVSRMVARNGVAAAIAADPLIAPMEVCDGTACAHSETVSLSLDEAAAIRRIAADPVDNAAQERAMLARAIALFETFVGARNGTWRDHPGNTRQSEGEPGQLDCVDESANTKTYLERLHRLGAVRFHDIGSFIHRYTFFLQHVGVGLVERESGEKWVVDSWVGANGEEPVIQLYDQWRKEYAV